MTIGIGADSASTAAIVVIERLVGMVFANPTLTTRTFGGLCSVHFLHQCLPKLLPLLDRLAVFTAFLDARKSQ